MFLAILLIACARCRNKQSHVHIALFHVFCCILKLCNKWHFARNVAGSNEFARLSITTFKLRTFNKTPCWKCSIRNCATPWTRCGKTAPYATKRSGESTARCSMVQPTITFPIGDHVNVLHDYKKMGPSNILKLFSSRCHHPIDIPVNVYQFLHNLLRTRGEKMPKILPPIEII